jgi:glucose/mannose-6-phosphate isomerase
MSTLDDQVRMDALDTDDMYHKIIHMPEHILTTYEGQNLHTPPSDPDYSAVSKIIFCGMGGSAISGDIARSAFSCYKPFEVIKDYNLPAITDTTMVIACSYSGNTEETLSCLRAAIKQTPYIGAITSGGEVRKLVENNYPWVELTPGLPPRSAIGYLFFSVVKLLEFTDIIPSQEKTVQKVVAGLMGKAGAIAHNVATEMNLAKSSAEKIKGKIPIIYASRPPLASLAYRWKCQINENAKYPAFTHTFPEMNHNEIEGWEAAGFNHTFIPIFLASMQEEHNYQKRLDVFKHLLRKTNVEYLEFFTEGCSLVEEIFSLIYLGDMISYYLAILQEVNPTSIAYIHYLKEHI